MPERGGLCRAQQYGKKVIILLDEYDTSMQKAFVSGYRGELVAFTRGFVERIKKYGFAFCGKEVLIGAANETS